MQNKTEPKLLNSLIAVAIMLALVFLVLSIIPRATQLEIEAAASQMTFVIPAPTNGLASEDAISLLDTALRVDEISIQGFAPFELIIEGPNNGQETPVAFEKLRLEAIHEESKVIFSAPEGGISLQDLLVLPDQMISIGYHDAQLRFSVDAAIDWGQFAFVRLSTGAQIQIHCMSCSISSGTSREVQVRFDKPTPIMLHPISKAIELTTGKEAFVMNLGFTDEMIEDRTELLYGYNVNNIDFTRGVFSGQVLRRRSTIRRIEIRSAFKGAKNEFEARSNDDLRFSSDPDGMRLQSLFLDKAGLVMAAGGKFKSFEISQGGIIHQLVPGFLQVIEENRIIVLTIAGISFLFSVVMALRNLKKAPTAAL